MPVRRRPVDWVTRSLFGAAAVLAVAAFVAVAVARGPDVPRQVASPTSAAFTTPPPPSTVTVTEPPVTETVTGTATETGTVTRTATVTTTSTATTTTTATATATVTVTITPEPPPADPGLPVIGEGDLPTPTP